jgi:ATP-dependent DNA ligase
MPSGKKLFLRSRNDKDFGLCYTSITNALQHLPDETVIDGEVVALDRPPSVEQSEFRFR